MEALGGEGGDERGPVLAAGAEAVDEDEWGAGGVGGLGLKVMEVVAIDLDVVGLDVLLAEVVADLEVGEEEGVGVEGDGEGDR